MGGLGDPFGIVQEVYIQSNEQMVYAQPECVPKKWYVHYSLGFCNTNGSSNLG